MTNSSFLKKLFLALSIVLLVSCDKDFNEIGADIIEDDIHHDMIKDTVGIVAYDMPTGAVQSNNLILNQLGVYDKEPFGKTVSHFVTQIAFPANTANPKFKDAVIDTAYLYVPYFSVAKNSYGSGRTKYELDSIYGDTAYTFKLKVYENGYFLRDSDPGSTAGTQKYYSDDKTMVDALKVGSYLNDSSNPLENESFTVTAEEIVRTIPKAGDPKGKVIERLPPGIFVNLNKTVLHSKIMNAPAGSLLNDNVFKNYFRGLYFNVEQQANGESIMVVPQFSKGVIVIKYTDNEMGTDGEFTDKRISKTLTLNLAGNSINFYENTFSSDFNTAITTSDPVNGDAQLYVKGGAGSLAVIDINQAKIDELIAKNKEGGKGILINEARLNFYIDKSAIKTSTEPLRVYLYDLNNNTPIRDYYVDVSSSTVNPKFNKIVHGGIMGEQTIDGVKKFLYRIRLTNHISNIIKKDSTNVKLGLVVSENINLISSAALKTPFTTGGREVNKTPAASVMHPFGTILYGSNLPKNDPNRLQLEIFYTKPN